MRPLSNIPASRSARHSPASKCSTMWAIRLSTMVLPGNLTGMYLDGLPLKRRLHFSQSRFHRQSQSKEAGPCRYLLESGGGFFRDDASPYMESFGTGITHS